MTYDASLSESVPCLNHNSFLTFSDMNRFMYQHGLRKLLLNLEGAGMTVRSVLMKLSRFREELCRCSNKHGSRGAVRFLLPWIPFGL